TVPEALIEQVLGQEDACAIIRQAAKQRRHVLLVGEPGTGKSMLGQAMAELIAITHPEDIVVCPHPLDPTLPQIRCVPAGQGVRVVDASRTRAYRATQSLRFMVGTSLAALMIISLYFTVREASLNYLIGGGFLIGMLLWLRQHYLKTPAAMIPKLLVQHPGQHAPFVDATGLHAGALLGDVRHDPYQSGGVETAPHHLVEAGAIHRAHSGVLYIDEVSLLGIEAQNHLLTAMQERSFAITGRSLGSSGTMVRTDPVPCDFVLVLAGNVTDLDKIHPALRSRIRGYGYEIYTHAVMADTPTHRWLLTRLVAQEVRRDGKIPHFSAAGVQAILAAARQRAGQPGKLSCRFRELGGLIRIAGDVAVHAGAPLVQACHVHTALRWSLPIEEQMTITKEQGHG
ncbi:MAG: ATP-dependent protease LonB, partial [Candidatus Tectomicrobia bacterium]|nr:ATP-dependent protease LonB [Candidatus Tectomicrobia bacterium]